MRRLALIFAFVSVTAFLAACNTQPLGGGGALSQSDWTGTWKGHINYQATYNAGYHSDLTLQVTASGSTISGTGTVHTYNDANTASFTVTGSFSGTLPTATSVDASLSCSTASGFDQSYQINSCSDLSWSSTQVVGGLTSKTTANVSLPDMANNSMIGDPAFGSIDLTKQ